LPTSVVKLVIAMSAALHKEYNADLSQYVAGLGRDARAAAAELKSALYSLCSAALIAITSFTTEVGNQ